MSQGNSTPIEVAAGLVFHDRRLLIARRPRGSHLAGYWEFPGGKRQPGETFENCLARELREELGVTVEIHALVATVTHAYPGKTVHLKFFACGWRSGEPQALGCDAFAWVRRNELSDYRFPAADVRLLDFLRESPALWGGRTISSRR